MQNINISFGIFEPAPGATTPGKHYARPAKKGDPLQKTQGAFGEAIYRTVTVTSPRQLIEVMQAAPPGSYITQGIAKDVGASRCVPAATLMDNPGAIARSNDCMIEPEAGALVTIDYDPPQYPDLAPGNIPTPAQQIFKIAGNVFMVNRPSTSAYIADTATGELYHGERGRHINLAVEHGSEREEQLDRLHKQCVLHGWYWPKIDSTGKVTAATIVDLALKRRVQPQFLAPVLGKGLVRATADSAITTGSGGYLNIPALTFDEETEYERLVTALPKRPGVVAQAAQNHRQHVEKLMADGWGADGIKTALQTHTLRGDVPLHIRVKGKPCVVTVRDVLASPAVYHGADALDPVAYLEPDYANNYCAKLYLTGQKSNPTINSMAHGERVFMLVNDAVADFADAVPLEAGFSLNNFFSKHTMTNEVTSKMSSTEFLVPNLIPKGSMTVYVAEPNGGKTAIFTHYACEMAAAGLKVFYVNADANPSQLKAQQEMADKHGFRIMAPDAMNGGGIAGLLIDLNKLAALDVSLSDTVFIVDTLKKFTEMLSKNAITDFLSLIRKLVAKGATICLLAHTNKYSDKDGNLVFEGVGDLRADVDNMIYFCSSLATPDIREVTTRPDKTRATFNPISFRIRFGDFGVSVEPLTEVLPMLTNELRVMLVAATKGIAAGKRNQEALVDFCVDETLEGKHTVRAQIKKLCMMDNAPLTRTGGNGGAGYLFKVTGAPVEEF